MSTSSAELPAPASHRGTAQSLTIAALGVVYGDIGTSPLYAVRQSLIEIEDVGEAAVFGILSLIVWALILVVTVKYVLVIMRADNRGEGGLLALTALVLRTSRRGTRRYAWALTAGLIGAALFYGDGIITPTISVLSAVEGLEIATPFFEPYVVPISLALLVGLFAVQRRGTAAVGGLFGPVMLLWFAVLALLGLVQIARHPRILLALDPLYGLDLLADRPWLGFIALGAVFLAVTGAETLYADMGHFGRRPMAAAWLYIVFPALLLNYFGQGALILGDPGAAENPFYHLAPHWALYALVALASAATIIASQAVISGAFSMTRQAVQLGYLPRLQVLHTSMSAMGQVYVPRTNAALLVAIVVLVLGFQSSGNLGAAYGIAVSGMMAITTALAFLYMRSRGWSLSLAVPIFGIFLLVDAVFLSANLLKVLEGGWVPLVVAGALLTVMLTWSSGREALARQRATATLPLTTFVDGLKPDRPPRIAGTAVIMTGSLDHVPAALLHAIKHYKVLHERVALMTVQTEDVPHVPDDQRIEILDIGKRFFTIRTRYGFMDEPNVVRALAQSRSEHLRFDPMETSFVIGREKLRARRSGSLLSRLRRRLFILMSNNMLDATEFFRLPPNRVIELGGQTEI